MDGLTPDQKNKLDIILSSRTEELQSIMNEAYMKRNLKQYKILADPKYRQFIEDNLDGIRQMI